MQSGGVGATVEKLRMWLGDLGGAPRNLAYAVLVHIAFLAMLVVSLEWTRAPHRPPPPVNVIDAVVVDEAKVQAEMERLAQAEEQKNKAQAARQELLRRKAREAEQARKREEDRLAKLQNEQQETQRRLQQEQQRVKDEERQARELEQKRQQESARLEAIKREQQELEKKRREDEARLKQEEAKRKLEEEQRKRQEEAQRKREEEQRKAERVLQEQLASEERRLEAERERTIQSVIDRYVEIINQKVWRNWIKPPKYKPGLTCTVMVRLAPGGEVLNVRITDGSGDPIFDRSVETAVLKASPLPLPPDAALFDRFRELRFVFRPKD